MVTSRGVIAASAERKIPSYLLPSALGLLKETCSRVVPAQGDVLRELSEGLHAVFCGYFNCLKSFSVDLLGG